MKHAIWLSTIVVWMMFQRLLGLDYSPPILQSRQEDLLKVDDRVGMFTYDIVSEVYDPFGQPLYRVTLVLVGGLNSFVLRSTPNRIYFLDKEEVSSLNETYKTPAGNPRLVMGGYDVTSSDQWLYRDRYDGNPLYWWRRLSDVLVGLRFQLEDGVHHGWIRFSRADTHFTTVFQPREYDWNPIPDAPIGAGQPPVIPIATEVSDEGLRLSWSPSLATWTLESTGALSDDAVWVPVPEATGYEALLGIPDTSRYFRLRKP